MGAAPPRLSKPNTTSLGSGTTWGVLSLGLESMAAEVVAAEEGGGGFCSRFGT